MCFGRKKNCLMIICSWPWTIRSIPFLHMSIPLTHTGAGCGKMTNSEYSFLHGVRDTSILTKGIEYVVDEDGIAYCDFYKRTKVSDYKYEIGKIYDAT